MFEPLNLQNLAWAVTTLLKGVLLFYLLRRRLYRSHPVFFVYALATILQTLLLMFTYRHWGIQSIQSWNIFWASQAAVICARWLAVSELARKMLGNYTGIWKMANGLFFATGICALAYPVLASQHNWQAAVLNASASAELSIAAFLVLLFLFARYYRLPIADLERYLAIGFCLYSCFSVINNSMLMRWLTSFADLWNYLEIFAFFATLLLWISAVRKYSHTLVASVTESISPEMYAKLSLETNARLYQLNKQLSHLLHTEDSRS